MRPRHACLLAVLFAGLCISPTARAQRGDETARAAVRALAGEGDALMDKGDYAGALDRFRKAGVLIPAPTVRLREATCLEKLGRWIEAADVYRKVSFTESQPGDPPSFREATELAAQHAAALDAKIPRLIIAVSGSDSDGAVVEVDGHPVPTAAWSSGWPVNPGAHRVVARKGGRNAELTAEAKEGDRRQVNLALGAGPPASTVIVPDATQPASAGSAQRTWGWVSLGIGGVGLIEGAVAAGMAASKKSSLNCPDNLCTRASDEADVHSYNSLRTYSTVGFAVGAVGLGAGLVLLFTAPTQPEAKSQAWVRPWIGVGSAGMSGQF